jgi:hypothetical protein
VERVALVLLVACAKHADAPPSPLQDGAPVAVVVDAAAVAIDAAVVKETPTATKIVSGTHATCAVMSDASVRCWGGNTDGELGDGTTKGSATPVKPKVRGVKDLVLGDDFACALIDDSSVVCWGHIGFGKTHRSLAPVAVPGVRDVVRIFAVGGAACATDQAGALVCWGDVDARGHVTTTGAAHAPTPVPNLDHVVALTSHAALREGGEVLTWLDGGTARATGMKFATDLAERDLACALDSGGAVTCFADKSPCPEPAKPAPKKPAKKPKPKGKGKAKSEPPPEPTRTSFALPIGKATHLAFATGTCILSVAKRLDCVDVAHACKIVRPWPALVSVEETSGACARLTNGTVRCGASGTPAAPLIAGVANAIAISATATGGCALTQPHAVLCWDGTGAATPISF